MDNKEKARQTIAKLVDHYKKILNEGRVGSYNEANTRKNFILPFFEALEWKVYSEDIREEERASKGRVDYAFCINKIPKFFLEAKAFKIDLDEPQWAEQAVNYAWHKGVTWAILTDFEGIKVFNAEWKLKGQVPVFEWTYEEYIDKFDEIWWLSRESFEHNALLENARKKWKTIISKSPVGQQLFEDMMEWRQKLYKSIKEKRQEVPLDEELIDESVQRLLDRFIFIRTCEDREMEPATLKAKIREWGFVRDKKLMTVISAIFRDFDDGYNSNIFKEHICEKLNIDDDVLYDIIKGLYETKDHAIKYDFSAIDSDVLGGIYEQYLGHILKKERVVKKHQHRKEQGIYYTPTYIVDYIVKNTLGELLKTKSYREIMKLKILDPACGSGSFLIKAFETMDNYVKEIRSSRGSDMDYFRRFELLSGNIYGVDLDKQAVEIARLNLALKTLSSREKLPMLKNIRQGNSLISGTPEELKSYFGPDWQEKLPFNWEREYHEVFKEGGFDVIIGNPPYIQLSMEEKLEDGLKNYLIDSFNSSMGRLNTFGFFIRRGIDLLRDNGYMGFIIPNTILTQDYYEELRNMILNSCAIENIVSFENLPFKDAIVENIVLILRKTGFQTKRNSNNTHVHIFDIQNSFIKTNSIRQNFFLSSHKNSFNIHLNEKSLSIKEKLLTATKPLKDFLQINQAIALKHERSKYLFNKRVNQTYKPVLDGRDINRYSLSWKNEYLKYDINAIHSCKREDIFLSKEKILFRRVGDRLISTFDTNQFYALNTLVVMTLKADLDYNLKYFLALFNSCLMNYYYKEFLKSTKTVFSEIQARQVAQLPIKLINFENQVEFRRHNSLTNLAQELLNLHKKLQDSTENTEKYDKLKCRIELLDKEVNQEVYKLYGLTEAEIKIVEMSL